MAKKSKRKKDDIVDAEVVPSTLPVQRVRADHSVVLPTSKSDSEVADHIAETMGQNSGSLDIVAPDRNRQVAALTLSDLNPHQKFDRTSPVLMVWDNRNNQWALFRSLDEVAELFGECELYVAMPTFYKKIKRGFAAV